MNLLKYLFGHQNKTNSTGPDDKSSIKNHQRDMTESKPTQTEWVEAKQTLKASLKPCSLAYVGGFRPNDVDDPYQSWWGCFGLGKLEEGIPICKRNGKNMTVVFQILVDDLPRVPGCLSDCKLIVLWADPELGGTDCSNWSEGENGKTFCVRTYKSLLDLVPLAPSFVQQKKTNNLFPAYPLRFERNDFNRPSWDDFVDRSTGQVADSVYRSSDSDWFFGDGNDLPEGYDFKIGGWPDWWQGTQWPDEKNFAFMLEHSEKGKFHLGGGVLNFFVGEGHDWSFRGDFD